MSRRRGDLTTRSRWAWALLGLPLLLAGWSVPAAAQATSPTLTLARQWNQGGSAGAWTPYAITVRNDGPGTFTGTALLVSDGGYTRGGPPMSFPQYRAAVAVPAGAQRTLTVFAIEPSGGYRAELRDTQGRLLATASPAS